MSVLELVMYFYPYLRSAMVRFPLQSLVFKLPFFVVVAGFELFLQSLYNKSIVIDSNLVFLFHILVLNTTSKYFQKIS